MTAATAPAASRPARPGHMPGRAAMRLLRLELRRNAMLWMLPLAAALLWYQAYRRSLATPPLWNLRAMTLQNDALLDLVLPVVGAATWMGSRESRRRTTDLVAITARPRWARQLTIWAATTCWAMAAYLGCVGVVYAVTARQAAWGGPLWWPAAVGAAGVPALSAIGFVAGALFPSRYTAPLVMVAAFFGLAFGTEAAHGGHPYWQVSPLIAGAVDVGADPGVATFYHYLPDLSIAQVIFLAGLTMTVLGALGLPAGAGSRRLRGAAAAVTVAGLAAAGTAVALTGTARLDPHGMMIIPALHDAASDQPVHYTPICSHTAIPVCLNPAYRVYLPTVTAALNPLLGEVAGLPGAPVRIGQAAPVYHQERANGISITGPAGATGGHPLVLHLLLPDPVPGLTVNGAPVTTAQFAAQMRSNATTLIVGAVVYGSGSPRAPRVPGGQPAAPSAAQARAAVAAGLAQAAGPAPAGGGLLCSPARPRPQDAILAPAYGVRCPAPGTAAYSAARRFAALPASARHAWLVTNLAALRAGHISLAQLP